MKIENLIKDVIRLNKLNKNLHIKDKYNVCLELRGINFKRFEFDKVDFNELERYFINEIYEKLTTYNFTYISSANCWVLDIYYNREFYDFDLFIKKEED